MPMGQWNLEWLNHNAQRHYPLADEATCLATNGDFEIPPDFLVELDLPVHAAMDVSPDKFFISSVNASANGYSLVVSCETEAGNVDVAAAMIPRQAQGRNTSYALGGIGDFDDTVGKIVIGRLDSIDKQPAGLWNFEPAASRIEPDCVRPILRGVQAIIAVNGAERSVPLTGDIELEAGDNIQLVPILVEGQDPRIRINALDATGFNNPCICTGQTEVPCLKSINGVTTPDGVFPLIGDRCIQVLPSGNGLQLVDRCCQPCCSCEDLEAITLDLERLNTERAALKLFLDQLETNVNQMSLTVLGARLNDRGCVTCE